VEKDVRSDKGRSGSETKHIGLSPQTATDSFLSKCFAFLFIYLFDKSNASH